MTDYLSRHPSKYEGAAIQAEKLFNDWFTVIVVGDITPKVKGLASSRGQIKSRESENSERKNVNRVMTVHALTQANEDSKIVIKSIERETRASNIALSTSKISNVYIQANAENDRTIHKDINFVRNSNNAITASPPLEGKVQLLFNWRKQITLHGQSFSYPQGRAGQFSPGDSLWTRV